VRDKGQIPLPYPASDEPAIHKLTCRLIRFNDLALAASNVHIQLGVTDVTLPDPLIISVSLLHGRNIQIACNKCTAAVNLSINHSHNQAIYLPKEQ